MQDEDTNRKIVLTFLEHMQAPPSGILADDFELTVTGLGPSGRRRSPSEIAALQKASADAQAGQFKITPLSTVAEGNTVVVEAKGSMPMKNGNAYANEYSFHFELSAGQIKKMRTYCDTLYSDRLFPGV